MNNHPSSSEVQRSKEAVILRAVSNQLGVDLCQKVKLGFGQAWMEVDGATEDESILVEVFAHIGKLEGGQRHKVSTDALKLVALGESRPHARRILAFADQAAASSVAGWKAAVLEHHGIELLAVELSDADRAELVAAQEKQKMVNASPEDAAEQADDAIGDAG
jgi:hypothetical protein